LYGTILSKTLEGKVMPLYADSPQLTNGNRGSFWTGQKEGFRNLPLLTQQQSQASGNILQQALGLLQNPGQGPAAQSLINQFHTEVVPSLAERFAGLGSGSGGLRGSGYWGTLGRAGSGLEQALSAQSIQQAIPLLQLGLQPQYQTAHIPGQQGSLQAFAKIIIPLLIAGLTGGIGGSLAGVGFGAGAGAGLLGATGAGGQEGLGALLGSLAANKQSGNSGGGQQATFANRMPNTGGSSGW
jgi:hypothetical protein